MPTIPWSGPPAVSEPTALVMVSRFRLSRWRDVVPFLIDALRVRRQMLHADGLFGMSLVARPARREFWTLSAWRDNEALMAAVQGEPHRRVMTRYASRSDSAFDFFTIPSGELPPSWPAARSRIPTGR